MQSSIQTRTSAGAKGREYGKEHTLNANLCWVHVWRGRILKCKQVLTCLATLFLPVRPLWEVFQRLALSQPWTWVRSHWTGPPPSSSPSHIAPPHVAPCGTDCERIPASLHSPRDSVCVYIQWQPNWQHTHTHTHMHTCTHMHTRTHAHTHTCW